jgi:hypothetical protein
LRIQFCPSKGPPGGIPRIAPFRRQSMAIDPLDSFETDGNIGDSSAVFGSYPAPDEELFFGALPLFTPPPIDGANDLATDLANDLSQHFFSPTPLGFVQPGNEPQFQNVFPEATTGPSPQGRDARIREFTMQHSPEPQPQQPLPSPEVPRSNKRKREKNSADDDDDDEFSSPQSISSMVKRSGRKTAHNMIEKRYRTNLNEKIAALRDAVPSLRATRKNAKGEDVQQEDLQGLAPAHKLNKVDFSFPPSCYQVWKYN